MRPLAGPALALCVLTAWAALPAPAAGGTAERSLLESVNAFRAENGLPPLHASRRLERSSRRWARHIARSGRPRHADLRPDANGYDHMAEVIEWHAGSAERPAAALAAWRASPEHRALLLDPDVHDFGSGRARGRIGGRRSTVWVARLGGG